MRSTINTTKYDKIKGDNFSNYLNNQQLQCLGLFSSIKPFMCWCIISSLITFVLFQYFYAINKLSVISFLLIIPNFMTQFSFFVFLFSRMMSITLEQYLTASVTLFNDLIITIPRYILWELIFTSRWIWLSLHYFSATYSLIKLWHLSTFFSLELPLFLAIFFFVTGTLSFIRFFGKSQNIFFLSSQTYFKPISKIYTNNSRSNMRNYFEIIKYFILSGGEGNIKNALIFTVLSFVLTIPIFLISSNIPGVVKLCRFLIEVYSFDNIFISKKYIKYNYFFSLIGYINSIFIVAFYWYCAELQSANFRSLSYFNINEIFLINSSFYKETKFNEKFVPSQAFLKFINNINKKLFFSNDKTFSINKIINNIFCFLCFLFLIPTIFSFWYFFFSHKFKYEKLSDDTKNLKLPINIINEWHNYEHNSLYVLEKIQKQLEYIFSTVILLDSSIHTRITATKNLDLQIILQSALGVERKFSISQMNLNDWFLHFFSLENIEGKNNHIPRSINNWWYFNVLLSENLNNPKLTNSNFNSNCPQNWIISQSIIYKRNEIFRILFSQFQKNSDYRRKEYNLMDHSYIEDVNYDSNENEMTSQMLFLMQEMALYTIEVCILYIHCYNRFLAKNLVIDRLKSETCIHSMNQFINLSTEVKNRIFCAFEVGLLNSPYLHPIFEQEITRLYRTIEDSMELLLSLF